MWSRFIFPTGEPSEGLNIVGVWDKDKDGIKEKEVLTEYVSGGADCLLHDFRLLSSARGGPGVGARPLNFTVRFLWDRFRKPVVRRCFCSYNNLCASRGTRPSALRPWQNGAWTLPTPQSSLLALRWRLKTRAETMVICYGRLEGRMVVVGYVPRGASRHIFSMRKANGREQERLAPYFEV